LSILNKTLYALNYRLPSDETATGVDRFMHYTSYSLVATTRETGLEYIALCIKPIRLPSYETAAGVDRFMHYASYSLVATIRQTELEE